MDENTNKENRQVDYDKEKLLRTGRLFLLALVVFLIALFGVRGKVKRDRIREQEYLENRYLEYEMTKDEVDYSKLKFDHEAYVFNFPIMLPEAYADNVEFTENGYLITGKDLNPDSPIFLMWAMEVPYDFLNELNREDQELAINEISEGFIRTYFNLEELNPKKLEKLLLKEKQGILYCESLENETSMAMVSFFDPVTKRFYQFSVIVDGNDTKLAKLLVKKATESFNLPKNRNTEVLAP